MPFTEGSVAYARFRVTGGPETLDQSVLETLAANVLTPTPIGDGAEVQAGWVAGRHVYDEAFDADAIVFGDQLLVGMRIDTNRVPGELKRAYRSMAIASRAAESPTGFASRNEKRSAGEEADERCREELATGRHRRSRLVPIRWDLRNRTLFAPVFTDAAAAALRELLRQSFDAGLDQLSSGALAAEALGSRGRTRDYEDLAPSSYTEPPATASGDGARDVATPPVPWAYAGPEPKDFLGNEFLIWLWERSESGPGVETPRGTVAVAIDRVLDMDCAWDVTGKQMLRADGPARLPEAAKALQIGKWPRKAGLIVAAEQEHWTLTFQADRFLVTAARLPRGETPAASLREEIEDRLSSLEALDHALTGLYAAFLEKRVGDGWTHERGRIREWIASRSRGRGRLPKIELDADPVGAA